MINDRKIGFVGAGNMALAIVRGVLNGGMIPPGNVIVSSPSGPSQQFLDLGVVTTKSNREVALSADILIVATKPQQLPEAIRLAFQQDSEGELRNLPGIVLSLAAGITIEELRDTIRPYVSHTMPIFRVMPNVNAAVGQSVTAVAGNPDASQTELIRSIFSCLGSVYVVEEKHIDCKHNTPYRV